VYRMRGCGRGLSRGGSRTSFPVHFRLNSACRHLVAGGGRPIACDPGLPRAIQSARCRGGSGPSAVSGKRPGEFPASRTTRVGDRNARGGRQPGTASRGMVSSHSARPSHLTPADESLTRLADIGACVAPMDAATFRARARPIHRRSQALLEDAIAATANARVKPEGRGAWAGRSDSECVRFRWVGSADTRSIPAFARCE
jgi:hypothetical protein